MRKLLWILLAVATTAGCEKDDPKRYDMSFGRVCFPGATADEKLAHPGYSAIDSTFYATQSFKSQAPGVEKMVIEVPVKLIGATAQADRQIAFKLLKKGTTALPSHYKIVESILPTGKDYGRIRIEVEKSAELDTQSRTLVVVLTESPELGVGPSLYLKAIVQWNNMLQRPVATRQWATYNAFIDSDLTSGNSSPEAYSQAAHQLLLDAFGWKEIPEYGSEYSNYLDAWRAKAQAWYTAWKAANPTKKIVHEAGSMKGKEVVIRTK